MDKSVNINTNLDSRRPGRPPIVKDARNLTVRLSAEHIDVARKLGSGNVSEGLRHIIDCHNQNHNLQP